MTKKVFFIASAFSLLMFFFTACPQQIVITEPLEPPTQPTQPIKGSVSDTAISVTWTVVPRATSYVVYFDTVDKVAGAEKIDVGNLTEHTISSLRANTTYYIWIQAKNTNNYSAHSPSLTVKTTQ